MHRWISAAAGARARVMRSLRRLRWLAAVALMIPGAALCQTQTFEAWLQELRVEATGRGIKSQTLDQALTGIRPIPRVIELDRKQPEFKLTFAEYLDRVVSETRVRKGRERLAEHRALLEQVGAKYSVQPRFIVALWGIETNYGKTTGGFKVIPALATLAYDGRRSTFFRKELLDALSILDQGHVPARLMVGSWAGAMGQSQFMPSSFRRYAVDYDGDGKRDIWGTLTDVFASIANYLKNARWRGDQTWGRRVRLPAGFDPVLADLKIKKPIADWQALGVRRDNGDDLPTAAIRGAVIAPDGVSGRAFLVYGNFDATMRWNRSTYFATAVGQLSDRIAAP